MTHKEIKMEHVFNQFTAFRRSWHRSAANETPVAGTPESRAGSGGREEDCVPAAGGSARVTVRRLSSETMFK